MRLLALDLSTHVGWAFFAHRSAPPLLGTWDAPRRAKSARDHYGSMFVDFEKWLAQMLSDHRPHVVAFEAPILPRTRVFQKQRAIRMSYGFAASAEKVAHLERLRCVECHPSMVKVALASHGKASKRQMISAAVSAATSSSPPSMRPTPAVWPWWRSSTASRRSWRWRCDEKRAARLLQRQRQLRRRLARPPGTGRSHSRGRRR